MKTLTIRQMSQIKRNAQNIYPDVMKIKRLEEKKALIDAEIEALNLKIKAYDQATFLMAGHYSQELITRKVETAYNEDGTPKTNKDGSVRKDTTYVVNPELVKFNEALRVYEIEEPTVETQEENTTEETTPTEETDINTFNI